MKKNTLWWGVGYVLSAACLFLIVLLTDNALNSLLTGFAMSGMCAGLATIGKYIYWNQPKNREKYRERIEKETIELQDEMKVSLRDRSGRYSYILGLVIISVSIVIFSVLGKLGVILYSRPMILFLFAYLLSQLAAGVFIFRYLLKKY